MDKRFLKISLAALVVAAVWLTADGFYATANAAGNTEGTSCAKNDDCDVTLLKCAQQRCVCRWGTLYEDWSIFAPDQDPEPKAGTSICAIVKSLGGSSGTNAFGAFIGILVNIVTAMVVMAAVVNIVIGGYIYMTAGGDASRVQLAKTWIMAALLGIIIALAAYMILWTVNRSTITF